jgi:toxin ParE1/3/4
VPQLRQSRRARRDLIDLWCEIAANDPMAADRVYDRLEARLKILEQFAEAGRARPDIAPEARLLAEPPYAILYRIIPEGVQIVRIVHGARHISDALFRAGLE